MPREPDVFVIVPVRNQWALTQTLLSCLKGDERIRDVLILNDASDDGTPNRLRALQRHVPYWQERLHQTDRVGTTIYEAWNRGFDRARKLARGKPFKVLVTNNDIVLHAQSCAVMARMLDREPTFWCVYPDYHQAWAPESERPLVYGAQETQGVFGDGGMFGACFMLAGDRLRWTWNGVEPLITDLAYEWWWGDNHLAETIEQHGGVQARLLGLPVLHVNEGTASSEPWTEQAKWRDRHRWLTRHSRIA